MDWVLSGLTVIVNYLLGRKNVYGWFVMLFMNGLWVRYAMSLDPPQYGLLPAIFLNCIIAIVSIYKWFRDDKRNRELFDLANERTTIK